MRSLYTAMLRNKAVLLAASVTLVFVGAVFWKLHRRPATANTQSLVVKPWAIEGIPDADQRDDVAWEKTPECIAERSKMFGIGNATYGFFTAGN